jgi:DNA primase
VVVFIVDNDSRKRVAKIFRHFFPKFFSKKISKILQRFHQATQQQQQQPAAASSQQPAASSQQQRAASNNSQQQPAWAWLLHGCCMGMLHRHGCCMGMLLLQNWDAWCMACCCFKTGMHGAWHVARAAARARMFESSKFAAV